MKLAKAGNNLRTRAAEGRGNILATKIICAAGSGDGDHSDHSDNIREVLFHALERLDPHDPRLTKEERMAIHDAVHSDSRELYELAVRVIVKAVDGHFRHMAKTYLGQAAYASASEDDLMQTFYERVTKRLPRYDGRHSLITFFDFDARAAFEDAREEARGAHMSKHYQDQGAPIFRAMAHLARLGNENPTPEDIRDCIRYDEDRNISVITIQRRLDYEREFAPLDAAERKTGSDDTDPLKRVLADESQEELKAILDRLVERHKILITKEYEYISEHGTAPSDAVLAKMLQERYRGITADRVSLMRKAAHNEFRMHLRRLHRRDLHDLRGRSSSPVTMFGGMKVEDPFYYEDIDEAVKSDPNIIPDICGKQYEFSIEDGCYPADFVEDMKKIDEDMRKLEEDRKKLEENRKKIEEAKERKKRQQ